MQKPKFQSTLTLFLREWRERSGLTQDQLSERSGVNKTTISQIENRKIPVNERHLISFARVFKCAPADIVAWNPLEEREPLARIAMRVPDEHYDIARNLLTTLIEAGKDIDAA